MSLRTIILLLLALMVGVILFIAVRNFKGVLFG